MDENRKAGLRYFFFIASVAFFAVYLVFMGLALFSVPTSTPVFLFLMLVAFSLFIVQDTVNEKAEEVGDIGQCGFLSLPFFTLLIVLGYAVMVYYLQIKQRDDILWVVCALIDSTLFDKSLRALRKLDKRKNSL